MQRSGSPKRTTHLGSNIPQSLATYVSSDVVTACAVDPETGAVWSGEESWLRVRNAWTGEVKLQYHFRSGKLVTAVAVTAKNGWIGHRDGSISVFSLGSISPVAELVLHEAIVSSIVSTADGPVISISGDGRLALWDPSELRCISCVKLSDHPLTSCSLSGDTCFTGTSEGQLHAVSVSSQKQLSITGKVMNTAVRSLAVAGIHGDQLWVGGEDGRIGIVDISAVAVSLCCRFIQSSHESAVSHITYCPGDSRVWTASRATGIVIYDAATTNVLHTIQVASGGASALVPVPGSTKRVGLPAEYPTAISLVSHGYAWRVWACSSDGTIKAWQTLDSTDAARATKHVEATAKLALAQQNLEAAQHEIAVLNGKLLERTALRQRSPSKDMPLAAAEEMTSLRLENISLRERLQTSRGDGPSQLQQKLVNEQAISRRALDDLKRADAEVSMLRTQLAEAVGLGRAAPTDLRGQHTSLLATQNPLKAIYHQYVVDDVLGAVEEATRRRLCSLEGSSRDQLHRAMNEMSDSLSIRERYERQLVQDVAQLRSALGGEEKLGYQLRQAESERLRQTAKIEEQAKELISLTQALSKARQQLEIAREDEASLSSSIRQLEIEKRTWAQREQELLEDIRREAYSHQNTKDQTYNLRESNAAIDAESKARQTALREREDQIAQLSAARDGLAQRIKELEDRMGAQDHELQRARQTSSAHSEDNSKLRQQIDDMRSHYEQMLHQVQRSHHESEAEIADLGAKLRATNRHALEHKQMAEDRTADVEQLRQRLESSQNELRDLKQHHESVTRSQADIVAQLTGEAEELSRQVAEARRDARAAAEQVESVQRAAEAELRAALEKADEALRVETKLRNEAQNVSEQQHNTALSRLHSAQEECRRATMEIAETKLELQRTKDQLEQLTKVSGSERDSLLVQIDLVQEQSKRSERQAQQLVREATEHVELLQADAAKLRADIAAKNNLLQDAIRDREKAEAELRRQASITQNQVTLMDAEVATLQRQVQEGSFLGERTILQAEVTDLRQQVHSLQRELQLRRAEIRDLERAADDRNAEQTLRLRQEQNNSLALKSELEKLTAMIKIKVNTIATLEQHVADVEQMSKSAIADAKQQHESTLERLKTENTSLQKEVRRLEGEFAQCSRTLDSFQHEVKVTIRNERTEFESQIEEYKTQVQSLQKELRVRTADLTTSIKQQDDLVNDAQQALRKEKAQLVSANEDLTHRFAALEAELRARTHDWNEQKLVLLERVDDLTSRLRAEKHRAEAAAQEAEHRINQLEKDAKMKANEVALLRSSLEDTHLDGKQRNRSEKLLIDKQADALRDRLSQLERELQTKTSDIIMLQRIVDEKDVEHQLRWRDDRTTYEQQIAQHREDLSACRDVMKAKEREIDDLKQQLVRSKGEQGRALNEKSIAEGEVEALRLQLVRLQEKQKVLQTSLAENDDLSAKISSIQRDLSTAIERVAERDAEAKKLRSQLQIGEALIDEVRQQYRTSQDKAREDMDQLEEKLDNALRENASLKRQVYSTFDDNKLLQDTVRSVTEHQRSVVNNQQALADLARRDDELRTQMASIVQSRSGSGYAKTEQLISRATTSGSSGFVDVTGGHSATVTPVRTRSPPRRRGLDEPPMRAPQLAAETAASLLFSTTGQARSSSGGALPINLGSLSARDSSRHLYYSNAQPTSTTTSTTRTTRHF